MAEEKTVKVDLKRTYAKGGTNYGPGEGVEMPESLARGLGLVRAATRKAATKAKKGKKP